MATGRYNVSEAAAIVGISPSSMRNWCTQFGVHLSAGASPSPGVERVLNDNDVAILQQIHQWCSEHRTYEQIAALLAELDTATLQPYVEVIATEDPTPETKPTEAPQDLITALAILQSINDRYNQLERRIEAQETKPNSEITAFALGILAAGVVLLIAVALFWLGSLAGG